MFQLSYPVLLAQSVIGSDTPVSLELNLTPTSIVVTPAQTSVNEGSGPVQFMATAKYQYPGLTTPIPDKDVTNDPLTSWQSSDENVALVNTIGSVIPVNDLGLGSAPANISATYGGVTGVAIINVVGPPPPTAGGSGGGGSSGSSGSSGSGTSSPTSGGEQTPSSGGEQTSGDGQTPGEGESPGGDTQPPSGEEQTPPGGGDQLPPGEEGVSGEQPTTGGEETSSGQQSPEGEAVSAPGQGSNESPLGFIISQPPADTSYLPLERPYTEEELKKVEEVFDLNELITVADEENKLGVSRSFVVSRIAERLGLFELRKPLLDKCYKDLENCTAIFRMFSTFDGINLDPDNLVLFPDLANVIERDAINKMALLGVVQGYYGIEGSPFLPDRPISRVESLKVLASIVATLEKSKGDYVPEAFDFNALFYQEIYAASLLSKLQNPGNNLEAVLPANLVPGLRIAHALTEEGLSLIRQQKSPFRDVRPDLYDAHWYYPIVYGKVCGAGILGCTEGTEAKPDESPSALEIEGLISNFDKYIKAQKLDQQVIGDEDDDGVLNIDENIVYLTNPKQADTDGDELKDGEELVQYQTDPNKVDTDLDELKDGDEIKIYKTNPNLYDSDDDSFSDSVEILEGSDPLDKTSIPDDKNANRVADSWEVKYNVEVRDGSQDTDLDGVADILEYKYQTDPNRIDTDMDGFTDSEEILEILSDPNDPNSPGDATQLPLLINNFQYGQVVADPSPLVKGVGPASLADNLVKVQILLRNEYGSELMLGETQTDAKGRFVFIPDIEIKNGKYFILARAINKGQVLLSKPIQITIDTTLEVASAKPEKLEDVPITDEVIINKLVLKVDSSDGQPVLYGTLSEFGSRVNVTWQSLVVSSALIADTTDGSFSIKAPKLEPGRHTIYVQTVRKRDNALGRTLRINFDLGVTAEGGKVQKPSEAASIGNILQATTANIVEFVSKQSWPFWIAIAVIIVLAGGTIYYFFVLDKDDAGKPQKRKKR